MGAICNRSTPYSYKRLVRSISKRSEARRFRDLGAKTPESRIACAELARVGEGAGEGVRLAVGLGAFDAPGLGGGEHRDRDVRVEQGLRAALRGRPEQVVLGRRDTLRHAPGLRRLRGRGGELRVDLRVELGVELRCNLGAALRGRLLRGRLLSGRRAVALRGRLSGRGRGGLG